MGESKQSDWITEYAEREWQTAAFTNAKDLEACLRWFASRMNKEPCDTTSPSPDPVVRLEREVARLKEACWIFRTYGLPPSDVSGRAAWDRALLLIVGGTP